MNKLNYQKYLDLLEVLDVTIDGIVTRRQTGRKISAYSQKNGYLAGQISLKGKRIHFLIHTLVATRWLPQPTNFDVEASHCDETRTNNHASNLQWINHKANLNMPLCKQRQCSAGKQAQTFEERSLSHNHLKKRVKQYDLHGYFLKEFESVNAAARSVNGSQGGVSRVCRRKSPTYYGYIWKWA